MNASTDGQAVVRVELDALERLCAAALAANRTGAANAALVARTLVAAEADGLAGHGISRVPSYAAQSRSGKVDGFATPSAVLAAPAALRVDAAHGFAYPALALAVERLAPLARGQGLACAGLVRSHHFGAAGYHVERLAEQGLVALLFGNSPKAIAPWGGRAALFGTNPIAFAAPRAQAPPLVIDLSLSKVARGKIMVAAQQGRPIPSDWALDEQGEPTTDAARALQGAMLPIGEAKGAALALMVEILAAAVTGARLGHEASSFFDTEGGPPGVGQLLVALDPGPLSAGAFAERLETLLAQIALEPGARLPGARRLKRRAQARQEGVDVARERYDELRRLAGE